MNFDYRMDGCVFNFYPLLTDDGFRVGVYGYDVDSPSSVAFVYSFSILRSIDRLNRIPMLKFTEKIEIPVQRFLNLGRTQNFVEHHEFVHISFESIDSNIISSNIKKNWTSTNSCTEINLTLFIAIDIKVANSGILVGCDGDEIPLDTSQHSF